MHTQPQQPGTVLPARVCERGARGATFRGSSSKPHPSPSSRCRAVTDRDSTESTRRGPEITAEVAQLTEDRRGRRDTDRKVQRPWQEAGHVGGVTAAPPAGTGAPNRDRNAPPAVAQTRGHLERRTMGFVAI